MTNLGPREVSEFLNRLGYRMGCGPYPFSYQKAYPEIDLKINVDTGFRNDPGAFHPKAMSVILETRLKHRTVLLMRRLRLTQNFRETLGLQMCLLECLLLTHRRCATCNGYMHPVIKRLGVPDMIFWGCRSGRHTTTAEGVQYGLIPRGLQYLILREMDPKV